MIWTNWKYEYKVKHPVKSWDNTKSQGACHSHCSQYAINNTYVNEFLCSYQYDKKPNTCTISADNDKRAKSDTSHWKKSIGTPYDDGKTYPLYHDAGKQVYAGVTKVTYSVTVNECYPKNGWGGSLIIGPYTSITSDSCIAPDTFLGSVGIVGDVSMYDLVCTASVSADMFFGIEGVTWAWVTGASGGATITASANGAATVSMASTNCTTNTTDPKEGILLSADTCDISLKKVELNACDCGVKIHYAGVNIDVGDLICELLKENAWGLTDSLAEAGAGAAADAIEDEFKNIYTDHCLPPY